jgi:hypothetical protein
MEINWIYEDKDFSEEQIEDNYCFVYVITNLQTGKKYIGKKFFYSLKTKVIKGKKKRQKLSSDWKTYFGSNTELQNDVKLLGQSMFKREIIYLCKTKGECGYMEAKEQFQKCVLESNEYYNTWIMVRVRKNHLKGIK